MHTIHMNAIIEIVKEAGKLIQNRQSGNQIHEKGPADFVTETDLLVQSTIFSRLKNLYPDIAMVGEEENDFSQSQAETKWILDPIDGTTNYIYDYQHSAISLALCENNKPTLAIIYNPFTEELFTAQKGKGACLNGSLIHPRPTTQISRSLVAIGTSPYHKEISEMVFEKTHRIYQHALDIRRTGSAALDMAYVACGRQDAYFEFCLKPWDYAAGLLILQEAGGVAAGIGEKISLEQPSGLLVAATDELMAEIATVCSWNGMLHPNS